MKLRNKKTGDLGELQISQKHIAVAVGNGTSEVSIVIYSSINELNEDWEDAEDIDVTSMPLIKDEKIRKAVRAWAETNDFTKLEFVKWADNHWLLRAKNEDGHEFDIDFFDNECKNLPKYEDETFYTIAELCGEEEE